ncbi:MAG: TonB-dependent receptor [Owenweeksia sp.]
MKKAIQLCIYCLAVLASYTTQAQTGKVRGFVYDKTDDQPIPFANAVIDGTTLGAVANDDGYFVISNIAPGKYILKVTFLGYTASTQEVEVKAERITTTKVYLEQSSEILQDVEVSAERQERQTKVLTSVVTLDPKEIKQFSVGGDADIIKALQVLPGVVTTGDQGGQVYIRGGAPIQNLILLDGMIVYNPFHSIGFFSVFDVDIIQSADVYSGGFNAEYGSRNSAVMDIQTRDPNRRRFAGKVSASTYTSKVLLETPLGAKNDDGLAASSFLVSAKTSYLDKTSSIFYPYVETEYGELPFSFTDIYSKFTVQSENGSKANLFGFSFQDAVRFGGDNSIEWSSYGGGADFTVVPPSSSVLLSGDFSFSQYAISSVEGGGPADESLINGFNGGLDFTYFLRENDELKYGLEAIGYRTDLTVNTEAGTSVNEVENTTELGAYLQYKIKANRLIIQPGFRVHYYGSLSELSLEPRLGFKYNITDDLRLKGAGGFYSQNLVASNSDRDVVNLFYGFLSSPTDDDKVANAITDDDSPLQKARHAVLGLEYDFTSRLTVNIEGYIKDFYQLTNLNRNQIYPNIPANEDQPDVLTREYITEQGYATGLDFLVKYRDKKLYLWLAYSISEVTRNDGIIEYFPHFDRRHNLNFVGTYVFGKEKSWELSTRYNFGSGFPFTPTQLYYSEKPFTTGNGQVDISYDYATENGEQGTLYGTLNSKRLPNYHRVDVSVSRLFKFSENQELEVSAGATNILNYDNIFYYDREDIKRVNQLPIMPSLSLSYSF